MQYLHLSARFTSAALVIPVNVLLHVQLELVFSGEAFVTSITLERFILLGNVELPHVSFDSLRKNI